MRVQLKDVASFSKGKQINGDDLVADGKYAFLNGGINPSGKWHEYNVEGNSIAISEGGNSCGYVNYMEEAYWCGAHCYYLYDLKYDAKYIYYALKSQQDSIMQLRSGACMPNIKKNALGEFKFSIEENKTKQALVVASLDKVSELISLRKEQLVKLDELVKARFVELFGDPVSNPKGWKTDKAEKHIDLLSGFPFDSSQYTESGVNICGGLIIMPQRIDWNDCKHWCSIEGYEEYTLKENDIVMALDRPWISEGFKVAMLDAEHLPALLIQRTARIRAIDIDQRYLMYCFLLGGFDKHCNVTGSLVPHISAKDIRSFSIMLPPLELQEQFAAFVEQTDKSKSSIQQSLDKLETLKKSLMQKYFG